MDVRIDLPIAATTPHKGVVRSHVTLLCCLLAAICGIVGSAGGDEADDRRHFDLQVAPLLARRCLECHNPSDNKGELDLTRSDVVLADGGPVVAGKPDESSLWQRVAADEMPPKKPLSAAEKQVLSDWIAGGARWGQSPIDRFRFTSDARAGHDWWSLQPVVLPALPKVSQVDWPRGPLDRFVLARLEAAGLAPSPEADRRTLIRRLTYDLTGLPPSPAEVASFIADADPQAYEKLVDRLLASSHYGERWARHWLDLARFGESNGFEYDEPRPNAWPYRDWVIDALNRDLPYDEFARLQLAGDVLRPADPAAVTATGFLVAGAYDTAGQNQQSLAMKAVVRQDELEDMVSTVGQTFLGLTVHCARCHDHKFDPIRQEEYYRLTAALGGVRHGQRDVTTEQERGEFVRLTAERRATIAELRTQVAEIDEPVRKAILQARGGAAAAVSVPPAPLARWDFSLDLTDRVGDLDAKLQGAATQTPAGLQLDGVGAFAASAKLVHDLTAKTLEAWLTVDGLQQAGGAAISVQTLDGAVFDAIVFGEREPAVWMAGSDGFSRTSDFGAPAETEAHERLVHVAITYAEDGTVSGYRNGQPYGKSFRADGPVTYKPGKAQVVFGLRHGSPGGNRMLRGTVARAQLYDRALSAEEVAASAAAGADFVAEAEIQAQLSPTALAERTRLIDARRQLEKQLTAPQERKCYAVTPRPSEPAHLLARGDIRQPQAVVAPGGVAALIGVSADFALPPTAPDAEARAALARWITSPANPLFARVIVNRLWQHHFGLGLVDTPNDFGFNGSRPSHPELLDWLAASLVDQGYSLKQMHRTIVLSATYRQSGQARSEAAKVDVDNRWLWRKSLHRLEAESVRDSMLAVSGSLNPKAGGPGYRDCQEVLRSGSYSYVPADFVGPEFNRRSIYRVWTRGGRSGLLDAFDCPDPSTTSPKRAVTTTPLQALALLNNAFVLRMSEALATRVEREADNIDDRIIRAYQLAYGRNPDAGELELARRVSEQHGLAVLARAILNSNEFLYID